MQSLLRMGVVHTVGAYVLSIAMPMLRRNFPETRIHVREERSKELQDHLADGQYDVIQLPELPVREDFIADPVLLPRFASGCGPSMSDKSAIMRTGEAAPQGSFEAVMSWHRRGFPVPKRRWVAGCGTRSHRALELPAA